LKHETAGSAATLVLSSLLAALLAAAPASAQVSKSSGPTKTEVFQGRQVVANEVLVKFHRSATAGNVAQAEQDEDVDSDEEVGGVGVRLFHSRSRDVATLISRLSARPDVDYVEPNYVIYADTTVPNDPSFSSLWGLRNTGQVIGGVAGTPGADIGATSAWAFPPGRAPTWWRLWIPASITTIKICLPTCGLRPRPSPS
jgi:hypothetical protein